MVSGDYVTNEVLSLHMSRMESLMREHIAQTDKQLAAMREENAKFREQMKDDFREFRESMQNDFKAFKGEINAKIDSANSEINARFDGVNTRFDRLESQIGVMQNDITGLKHDVNTLFHWDYWILAIIVAVFAMPQIVESIKSLFGAVRDGVAGILALFRSKSQ